MDKDDLCGGADICCSSLEAEAVHDNQQLYAFNLRSREINWVQHVKPLLPRGAAFYLGREFQLIGNVRTPVIDDNRREVLVCHDMMGNYLEDKHYHKSKKFDDYRFFHWAAVDYFCYFSHNYITIPPCGWINAAHKHGVRILGTYIVEGTNGSRLLCEVLQSRETIDETVNAMTKLCKHFVFDGWLINIECTVNAEQIELLSYFVERLRTVTHNEVNHGVVFWYDSVIESGELHWQNELNERNVRFFRVSDGMLINYNWNDSSLTKTKQICNSERTAWQRVFFGIDVFGRGQIAKFQTKMTLSRIVRQRFSIGIFAPAWTYETLQQYGYNIRQTSGDDTVNDAFLLRNDKWWYSLWDALATHTYTELPFYTDFCLGSGRTLYQNGKALTNDSFFNLSRQSAQPSVPLRGCVERNYNDAFNGGSSLRIIKHNTPFRLLACDMRVTQRGLIVGYAFRLNHEYGELDCVLRFCDEPDRISNETKAKQELDCYIFFGDYFHNKTIKKGRVYVSPLKPSELNLLTGNLVNSQLPKEISTTDATNWRVRYYIVGFDAPVRILDFGALYRTTPMEPRVEPLLGAIYLQQFDLSTREFDEVNTNYAFIPARSADLYNSI